MRALLTALITVAACGGAPELELAVCAGGSPIDASARHSMSIHANGHVRIDGVGFAEGSDAEAALEGLMKSMHTNEAVAVKSGFLYAVDEPLLVRIDRGTPFSTAAYWLGQVRHSRHMYVTWFAIKNDISGADRCLRLERPPMRNPGCVAGSDLQEVREFVADGVRVDVVLTASDSAPFGSSRTQPPVWAVSHWTRSDGTTRVSDFESWSEARAAVQALDDNVMSFYVAGTLPKCTPWSAITPIVAEALTLWDARVTFGYPEAP